MLISSHQPRSWRAAPAALLALLILFSTATHAALSLTKATSCSASDGGVWTVGSNSNVLTFVRSLGTEQTPFNATGAQSTNANFNPGKCIEANATQVFFFADSHVGYITIQDGTGVWQDVVPGGFNPSQLTASLTAVGPGAAGSSGVVLMAANNTSIIRWDTSLADGVVFASIAELGIPSAASIIDMAMSSSPAYELWIYYRDSSSQPQLGRFSVDSAPAPNVTGTSPPQPPQVLVPLTAGDGVAFIGANTANVAGNTLVTYFMSTGKTTLKTITTEPNALSNDLFVTSDSTVWQINPAGVVVTTIGGPATTDGIASTGGAENTLPTLGASPHSEHKNQLPVIIGSVVGAIALIAIIAAVLIVRRRKSQGGHSVFAKKQKNMFPANTDETMVPLGLYHQNTRGSSPEVPRLLENDLERLGYGHQMGNEFAMASGPYNNNNNNNTQPYHSQHSRDGSQPHLDETIPIEAALAHHRYDMHSQRGLTHSISVSSTTSRFPRQSPKGGKRFEEKIQLQVIRYDVPDAHLVSPHGPTGRLVLGTYHVISEPRSARSVKAQGGVSARVARSGTVVVRKSRMDTELGATSRALSPLREMAEESSMLLTDAENQHTFETATLKWYMTEIHWKREAALLKHLKSPIFVMELLESYCIPALQNRVHTYPFVNAMGGCSSLLSDVGPVRSPQHARSILRSISAAVDWCHRHGVVHLNLQPGSFFVEEGVDPKAEDASWKLWDFTCARFMGEPIGPVGGGGDQPNPGLFPSSPQPPPNHTSPDAYPIMEQQQLEERLDRIGGNPLPATYTAPELLEAWRAGDTTFPAEAGMDTWSLGCVYYEVLSGGRPLFRTETEAWALIGGWENKSPWTVRDFRVPSPFAVSNSSTATDGSPSLDPSGSIFKLLHDMMAVHADERVSVETIMERIY